MQKYDVVILGAGIGGLAAAALLTSKGKKTLVLEAGPSLNAALGITGKTGLTCSAGPSLFHGLEPGGAIHVFFDALGIHLGGELPSPLYQVALPDRRITVFPEAVETYEELRREFPQEASSLEKFYEDIRLAGVKVARSRFWKSWYGFRSARGFLSGYGFSQELKTFFDVQSLFFLQMCVEELSLRSLIALFDSVPRKVPGGMQKIAAQLHRIIQNHGGEIRFNESFTELLEERAAAIVVKTSGSMVEANTIIFNTRPEGARSGLVGSVRENVLPVGMARDVLYLSSYGNPEDFLALTLGSAEDKADSLKKLNSFSLSYKAEEGQTIDKQFLVGKLGGLVPFLNENIGLVEACDSLAGHVQIPAGLTIKPLRSREGASVLHRTSRRNVFVLHDLSESFPRTVSALLQAGKVLVL